MISIKLHENSLIARIAAYKLKEKSIAITLGRHIFLYKSSKQEFLQDMSWICHELAHVAQYRRYGFIRFVFLYCKESARNGYFNNRFEKEARERECDKSLLEEYTIV
ncbi:MAG: DUF4157 domain-containing protein [Arachidicoccus sp.]|nr:DUF4157 domain-containing protein [Arachidicoccus sp.]